MSNGRVSIKIGRDFARQMGNRIKSSRFTCLKERRIKSTLGSQHLSSFNQASENVIHVKMPNNCNQRLGSQTLHRNVRFQNYHSQGEKAINLAIQPKTTLLASFSTALQYQFWIRY